MRPFKTAVVLPGRVGHREQRNGGKMSSFDFLSLREDHLIFGGSGGGVFCRKYVDPGFCQ